MSRHSEEMAKRVRELAREMPDPFVQHHAKKLIDILEENALDGLLDREPIRGRRTDFHPARVSVMVTVYGHDDTGVVAGGVARVLPETAYDPNTHHMRVKDAADSALREALSHLMAVT